MSLRILYGGTFDPVHAGHIAVAERARDVLAAEVALLPAGDPPHKGPTLADAAQRVAMCELAIAGRVGLRVDPREALRDAPSWTVHTLESLRREIGGEAPVALLIGADSFLSLPTWRRWEDLFHLAHFVVAERPGHALDPRQWPLALRERAAARIVDSPISLHETPAGHVLMMNQPEFPHSSSEIRARIAQGAAWQDWVDPTVAEYIESHHLYR